MSDFMKGLGIGLLLPIVLGYVAGWVGGFGIVGTYLYYIYIIVGIIALFFGFKN